MKVKPTKRRGRVLMEVGSGESKLLSKGDSATQRSPLQLKRILVPVDFSDCSKKALQYALPFARQFQATLALLYVVQIPYGMGEAGMIEIGRFRDQMGKDGARRLAALLKKEDPSIHSESIVREGSPYNEIIQLAKEKEIDLIILST